MKTWPRCFRPIGKTGRKDREREGTQDDGMAYVNISIPVPKLPKGGYYPRVCRMLRVSEDEFLIFTRPV